MQYWRRQALVPVLVFIGGVMSVISSLGAPLIPRIAERLHTNVSNAQWALTVTVLVAAVASPVVGRLGDGHLRKRVLVTCLGVVVIGGALSSLATTLPILILGRACQGLGLALLPLAMAVARDHLPAQRGARTIAALSVVAAAGVGLGYPVSGLLSDHGGVAVAYWVGTAVSALALVSAWLVVPESEADEGAHNLDLLGAILIAAALILMLIALDRAPDWGWGSARVLCMLAGGVAIFMVWGAYELRATDPLIDLRLVKRRPVLTANVVGLLLGVVMYISMMVITEFVQLPGFGLHKSTFVAGLTLVPLSILSSSVTRTLPWVTRRIGLRLVIPFGTLMVGAALVFFVIDHSAVWQILISTGMIGIGLGFTFAAMPGLILRAVSAEETSSAMGFYQVSRYIGFAIGSGHSVTAECRPCTPTKGLLT